MNDINSKVKFEPSEELIAETTKEVAEIHKDIIELCQILREILLPQEEKK